MRLSVAGLLLLSLAGCGRSRTVTPAPTDGGVDAAPDAAPDAGMEPGFRFAIVRSDCGPADGPAWSGVVSRTPLTCDDFGTSAEHVALYFFDGAMTDRYVWPGASGNASYCPGGLAPCVRSSEGEAQLLLDVEDLPPTLELRAVFPTFTIETMMRVTVCFEDAPTPCG